MTIRSHSLLLVGRHVRIGRAVHLDALAERGIRLANRVTIDRGARLIGSGVVRSMGVGIEIDENAAVGACKFCMAGAG